MAYDLEQLRELMRFGQEVAREILKDSVYSGREVTYWNGEVGKNRSSRLALFAEGDLESIYQWLDKHGSPCTDPRGHKWHRPTPGQPWVCPSCGQSRETL